jgi:hypothetical protein
MRKLKIAQNGFHSGEITPNAFAQDQISAYVNGVKRLVNYNLLNEGGIERRPGLQRIAALSAEAVGAPFEFSEDQKYALIFRNLALDVYLVDDSDPTVLPVTSFVETVTTNATWTTSLLDTLRYHHSGDTMFLCDGTGSQIMKRIVRTSATTFEINDFEFEENSAGFPMYQPYYKFASSGNTMTPSATTGAITLTLSEAHWTAAHVGDIVRYVGKEVLITGYTSSTVVSGAVRQTLSATVANTDWDEPVISPSNGYPLAVSLAEQRLHIAGTRDFPHGNWFSNTTAFFKFDEGTGESNEMIDRPIDSGKIETIRGVNVNGNIEIFTDQGEHYIPLSETQALTPSFSPIRAQDKNGISPYVRPITYDGATIFVQRIGIVLREFIFTDSSRRFVSTPLSLLGTHLYQQSINGSEVPADVKRSAVINGTTRRPESYYYNVNIGTGELICFHSIRSEKVAGFARYTTPGKFHDIFSVGNQLFAIVKRATSGNAFSSVFSSVFGRDYTNYSLERFDSSFTLDWATYLESPTAKTVWTGLDYLANQEVHVVSRNAVYHGTFTVSAAGVLTIDEPDTSIVVGLDPGTMITTLRPRFNSAGYTIMGEIKRLVAIKIEMSNAYSLTVQATSKLIIRKVTDDLSMDPVAVTGLREFPLRGYGRGGEVVLTQSEPLPLKILGYSLEVMV